MERCDPRDIECWMGMRPPIFSKDGYPLIHKENDRYSLPFVSGIYGVIKDPNILLDKLIIQAEMVGMIASHDPKVRAVDPVKEGTSGEFLRDVYLATRDLATPEDKRQVVRSRVKFASY